MHALTPNPPKNASPSIIFKLRDGRVTAFTVAGSDEEATTLLAAVRDLIVTGDLAAMVGL